MTYPANSFWGLSSLSPPPPRWPMSSSHTRISAVCTWQMHSRCAQSCVHTAGTWQSPGSTAIRRDRDGPMRQLRSTETKRFGGGHSTGYSATLSEARTQGAVAGRYRIDVSYRVEDGQTRISRSGQAAILMPPDLVCTVWTCMGGCGNKHRGVYSVRTTYYSARITM